MRPPPPIAATMRAKRMINAKANRAKRPVLELCKQESVTRNLIL